MFERVDIDADRLRRRDRLVGARAASPGSALRGRRLRVGRLGTGGFVARRLGFGLSHGLGLGGRHVGGRHVLAVRRGFVADLVEPGAGVRRLVFRRPVGVAEGALQLVERHFARLQFPFKGLRRQGDVIGRRIARGRIVRRRGVGFSRHGVERFDQVAIGAFRLGAVLRQVVEDVLDAVDGIQDQRDAVPW